MVGSVAPNKVALETQFASPQYNDSSLLRKTKNTVVKVTLVVSCCFYKFELQLYIIEFQDSTFSL